MSFIRNRRVGLLKSDNPVLVIFVYLCTVYTIQDVCLNNVPSLNETEACDIFDALRHNTSLTKLSVVNCDVSSILVLILIMHCIHMIGLSREGPDIEILVKLNIRHNKSNHYQLKLDRETVLSSPIFLQIKEGFHDNSQISGQDIKLAGYPVLSDIC